MDTAELKDLFIDHDREYIAFHKVQNPRSKRPDLHAFLLLDELVPGTTDMIGCAWRDNIGISVDLEDLARVITEEQVIELIRCGVRIGEHGNLCMYA